MAEMAVIGAGSWGTALAILLAQNGHRARLWARRPELTRRLEEDRENRQYLPGIPLPPSVIPTDRFSEIGVAELVVLAIPSVGMRQVCRWLAGSVRADQPLVSVAKGLEHSTGERMSQVIAAELGGPERVAVLSGPNLASEVAAGIASTTVVAAPDEALTQRIQQAFMQNTFRVYTNPDVIGVELGGTLKNPIAIGAGISDGLGFGDNTKAALVARGLAEITRLGVALGAQEATFRGLSGLGDLVATCASRRSRNHQVGWRLARGETLAQILAEMDQIAEGVPTCRAALELAAGLGVEVPINRAIYQVLFEAKPPAQAVTDLMSRAGRCELE